MLVCNAWNHQIYSVAKENCMIFLFTWTVEYFSLKNYESISDFLLFYDWWKIHCTSPPHFNTSITSSFTISFFSIFNVFFFSFIRSVLYLIFIELEPSSTTQNQLSVKYLTNRIEFIVLGFAHDLFHSFMNAKSE